MEGEAKCKILVIGATGKLGQWIAKASIALLHPTFALVRSSTIAAKLELIDSFRALGITILEGSLEEHDSLVEAIKQVDVVISAVREMQQLQDQLNIVAAIKEAGTVKRFLPSEYGLDVDRVKAHWSIQPMFNLKAQIRRSIEAAGVAHTYVCSFCFAGYFLRNLGQPGGMTSPRRDKVLIHGDGNTKVVYLCEEDIGRLVVMAAVDPRTMNKVVHLRFPKNVLSQNELVALWEIKIGKTLEKTFVPGEEMIRMVEVDPSKWDNMAIAMKHAVFVKGYTYNLEMGPNDVEASHIYPDEEYVKVDDYLQNFV